MGYYIAGQWVSKGSLGLEMLQNFPPALVGSYLRELLCILLSNCNAASYHNVSTFDILRD
jgi:hypothetical protein